MAGGGGRAIELMGTGTTGAGGKLGTNGNGKVGKLEEAIAAEGGTTGGVTNTGRGEATEGG